MFCNFRKADRGNKTLKPLSYALRLFHPRVPPCVSQALFRISELGEGWYVEKGRRYKQTNKPKTPNLSAALKPNSTVLPVKWKVRARKMAQREK